MARHEAARIGWYFEASDEVRTGSVETGGIHGGLGRTEGARDGIGQVIWGKGELEKEKRLFQGNTKKDKERLETFGETRIII